MMNPQYPPPGQNNNAPTNPLGFPPSSQEYNGVQNANIYSQMPSNGPQPMKSFDQDMSQKMQNMNINGPQGFPISQLPPGQTPPSGFSPNFGPGQMPGGQRPGPESLRPSVSGSQFPPSMGPPSSIPGTMPTSSLTQIPPGQTPNQFPSGSPMQRPPSTQSGPGIPPGSQIPSQGPPTSHTGFSQNGPKPGMPQMGPPQHGPLPSQPGQISSQPGQLSSQAGQMPPQPGQMPPLPRQLPQQPGQMPPQHGQIPSQPGQTPQQSGQMPPQLGPMPPQPGQMQPAQMPSRSGQIAPHHGQMPPQPGQMTQQSAQAQSQPGQMPSQPGQMPPQSQASQMQRQGMPSQPIPGQPMPPQARSSQPGFPPQPGQAPGQFPGQPGPPPQPGMQPGKPGPLSQPGQLPPQPGQMPPQPGQMPPQPGQIPPQPQQGLQSQPGFPPQQNQFSQAGLPSHPGHQFGPPGPQPGQPGLPPQPGQMPPQPGQPGLPPQPGQPGLQQPMAGLPHMPPPLSQQRQFPGQPGPAGPPGPPGPGGYPGMPPMPQQPQQPSFQQPQPGFQQPQPGYQQPPSGYPQQYQQPPFPGQQPSYPNQQYQQPPQKRLDPDQMPSPIQVMADDEQNRSGVFVTNDKGLVPPLVTTDFVVDDKGNASPRYIRSSMYTIPVTADLLKQTAMPFCIVLSPMAETVGNELPPPLLDFAALTGSPTMGPVRCSRCKAYMCPSMKFLDAGRHFQCAFCKASTEVPMEYTQYINSMQQYGRVPAELALGAYEIVATKEYCRNNKLPNPPAIVFVIDVSYNSIKNGLLETLCEHVMEIIAAMAKDEQTGASWTRVGFITYSSTVHFYNIKGTLAQPQMMSVGDVSDMFVPLLEGFLVHPEESGPVLGALLQQLPTMFQDNRETETVMLPAVQAGLEALKAAETSGQLMVFHTSLPTYNAPGKLTNREDRKLLGTDKEKQILAPQTTAYNELGQACSGAGVSVELFVCNNAYVDAATIGQLPRLTGGQLRKYTYFTAEVDGARLVADACRVASRATAHDAVMRLRTSTGVRATDFYGHMFMSNTTDVELAAVDADKALGIEIKHDDKLTAEDGVYLQAALLYTHRSGQRRLRILNLALGVAHQLADVYRSMELDTTINFLTKQAVWMLREHSPRAVREGLSSRCARSLAAYRRHCASPSSAGQLVLPESMKLLPLYTNCLLRSDALAGGPDLSCDDRSCAMYRALTADVLTSLVYTYPRLLPLHDAAHATHATHAPPQLRASIDKMQDDGVFLLENGVHILIWVGSQAPPQFISDVFGVPNAQQIDTQVTELPVRDNPASEACRAIVRDAREKRHSAMRLTVMRQHDKLETVLRHFLVEDRGADGSASYVDFLCHVHKEIRTLL